MTEGLGDQTSLGPGFGLGFGAAREPGDAHILLGHTLLEVLLDVADRRRPPTGPQPVVAVLRTAVSRYARNAMPGPPPAWIAPSTRVNASATMSSATSRGTIDSAIRFATGACSTYSSS